MTLEFMRATFLGIVCMVVSSCDNQTEVLNNQIGHVNSRVERLEKENGDLKVASEDLIAKIAVIEKRLVDSQRTLESREGAINGMAEKMERDRILLGETLALMTEQQSANSAALVEVEESLLKMARQIDRLSTNRNATNAAFEREKMARIEAIKNRIAQYTAEEERLIQVISNYHHNPIQGQSLGETKKIMEEYLAPFIKALENTRGLLNEENRRLNELLAAP